MSVEGCTTPLFRLTYSNSCVFVVSLASIVISTLVIILVIVVMMVIIVAAFVIMYHYWCCSAFVKRTCVFKCR